MPTYPLIRLRDVLGSILADGSRDPTLASPVAGASHDDATAESEPHGLEETTVIRLAESNGGRIYQSSIVDDVDASKATVSRVLCSMEEDGAISRVEVGRQKLVCLPTTEPSAVVSEPSTGRLPRGQ